MTLLFRLFDLYVEFVVSHVREFAEDDTWRGLVIEGTLSFTGELVGLWDRTSCVV